MICYSKQYYRFLIGRFQVLKLVIMVWKTSISFNFIFVTSAFCVIVLKFLILQKMSLSCAQSIKFRRRYISHFSVQDKFLVSLYVHGLKKLSRKCFGLLVIMGGGGGGGLVEVYFWNFNVIYFVAFLYNYYYLCVCVDILKNCLAHGILMKFLI